MHVLAILLIVLIQLVLAVTQIQNTGVGTIPFSGVYNPSLRFQSDDSAGAFLVAKDRLVNAIVPFHNSTSYKSRSYLDESAFVTVLRVKCSSCLNFLTRDFLDFFVEHLPSTINQLDPSQREAATYVLNGLKRTTKKLRLLAAPAHNYDKRLNQTVAVLVYNGDLTRRVSSKMKLTLFQATFWSVYRYYHNVVVVTKSAVEQSTVQGLKLPTQEIININLPVASKSKKQKYAVRAAIAHGALIKGALEVAALRLVQRGGSWGEFRYAYMSTADQLLHSRRFRDIYDAIDLGTEGNFLIAPHRMQTLPLAQNFPEELQHSLWPTVAAQERSSQWVPHVRIETDRLLGVASSCCEAGRILFPSCPAPSPAPTSATVRSKVFFGTVPLNDTTKVTACAAATEGPTNTAATTSSTTGRRCKETEGRGQSCASTRDQSQSNPVQLPQLPWTSCTEGGPRNFSSWMRVGPDGFAMPPVTVHSAYCEYSTVPRQCSLGPSAASFVGGTSSSALQAPPPKPAAMCTLPGTTVRMPLRAKKAAPSSPSSSSFSASLHGAAASSSSSSLRGGTDRATPAPTPPDSGNSAAAGQHSAPYYYHYCQESPTVRLNPYTVHLLSAETQQVLRQSSQLLQIIDDEEGQLGAGQKQDQELVQVPPAGLRRRSGGDVGAEVALKPTAATAGGRRKRDHP